MRTNPGMHYAMSSAQQFAWIKEHWPQVWERVVDAVARGRFHPVGGMWVESDTNMVGSEAMVRQFLLGQRFFKREFGRYNDVGWLPDSFGYSAALPQILHLAGLRWFFTQKISWNTTNVFPHHSFLWEGIDGTRIFTHFAPANTYSGVLTPTELARSVQNFQDKKTSDHSLLPYGWGDGGGGPTREMLQRAERARDIEGLPHVELRSPSEFFDTAQREQTQIAVWRGELYLEFHRATLTTQADIKRFNRLCERLLHEAEYWATLATLHTGTPYPYDELEAQWKIVLLHQFHDMLPGTSIAWVYAQMRDAYACVVEVLEKIIAASLVELGGKGTVELAANASPFSQNGVAGYGIEAVPAPAVTDAVLSPVGDGEWELRNHHLTVRVAADGTISSVIDASGREAIPAGERANLLQLHPDLPVEWDAWDLDEYYRNVVDDIVQIDELRPLESTAKTEGLWITRTFGQGSTVRQELTLAADCARIDIVTRVSWGEQEHLLKLAFPADVHSDTAAFETQFGHVVRPTHENTSWDAARFEVVGHRWARVSEGDYGVSVVNDSVYGHEVVRRPRANGGTYSVIRLSLLRGPRFPDPEADQGQHDFSMSYLVGPGLQGTLLSAYNLHAPLRSLKGAHTVRPLAHVDGDIVLETVKLSEDRSGDVVVRLYEPYGRSARARVTFDPTIDHVAEVDLLEEPRAGTAVAAVESNSVILQLRPFEIVSLRIRVGTLGAQL
jgi:alpha-mannosidase